MVPEIDVESIGAANARDGPRTASGALDLAQAPVQLQAIVNRIDLRDLASGDAGEGRFVFAFVPPDGSFNATATLAAFITANQAAILADRHTVPATLDGAPFQAGAIFNNV